MDADEILDEANATIDRLLEARADARESIMVLAVVLTKVLVVMAPDAAAVEMALAEHNQTVRAGYALRMKRPH